MEQAPLRKGRATLGCFSLPLLRQRPRPSLWWDAERRIPGRTLGGGGTRFAGQKEEEGRRGAAFSLPLGSETVFSVVEIVVARQGDVMGEVFEDKFGGLVCVRVVVRNPCKEKKPPIGVARKNGLPKISSDPAIFASNAHLTGKFRNLVGGCVASG